MSAAAAVTNDGLGSQPTTRLGADVVLLTCNDLHLTDVAPASRRDNYVDELFGLLDQIAQAAEKVKADAVCIAGDIFHSKDRPMGAPLLSRLIRWCGRLDSNGTAVLVIPGNHDLKYNNLATLPQQPLNVLLEGGHMQNVAAKPWWVCREHADVEVRGIPFPDAMAIDQWQTTHAGWQPLDASMRRVVLAHCFASLRGGEVYGEPEHAYADLYAACPADVYVFGHDHSNGGVTRIVASGHDREEAYFINLGALSRGTIGYDDITRDITIGLVRIGETVSVKQVKLKAVHASELFDLTAKAEQTEQARHIDAFIADLEATLASLDSTNPVETHLGKLTIAAEVKARMQRYIDGVEQS